MKISLIENSRTGKTVLTFAANLLIKLTQYGIGLVLTPFIVLNLGSSLYGVWQVINQLLGYMALADLRPMNGLKFILVKNQNSDDESNKRRVAAAIIIWLITLPFLVTVGIILVHFSPNITKVEQNQWQIVQIAFSVALLDYFLGNLLSLPSTVLRSMNLAYKGVGANSLSFIFSGIFTFVFLKLGLGIVGVATAALSGTIINGLINYYLVRKWVTWWGIKRPKREDFIKLLKFSGWIIFSVVSNQLVFSLDLVVIGILLSTSQVTIFVLNRMAIEQLNSFINNFLSSSLGSIGELIGRGEWQTVRNIRAQMQLTSIFGVSVFGAGVLALNRHFINLWVGPEYYAGDLLVLCLIIASFEPILNQVDSLIVDINGNIRNKAFVTFGVGILNLILAFILVPKFGLIGMAISLIISRTFYFFGYSRIIITTINENSLNYYLRLIRPLIVTIFMFGLAFFSSIYIRPNNWIQFFLLAAIVFVVFFIIAWWGQLPIDIRRTVINRVIYFKNNLRS